MQKRSIVMATAVAIVVSAAFVQQVIERRSASAVAAKAGTPMAASVANLSSLATPGLMATATAPYQTTTGDGLATVDVAAARLADRLNAKGGTGEEWALLARSYVELKRFPDAVNAFAHARTALPGDPSLMKEEAAAKGAAAMPPMGAVPRKE